MRSHFWGILLAVGASLASPAMAEDTLPVPKTATELDAQLGRILVEDQIPGAAIAVIENGQVTFIRGYGVANLETKAPVTPDTMFRAASISKSFTGIAVMTAVQEGKLDLNATLKTLAPDVAFANPWEASDPVRLAHLVEHTTGWPDISLRVLTTDGPGWSLKRGVDASSADFVSRYRPGQFAVYNNAGPAVAGLILERATGKDFNAYMRERVLRPMGILKGDFDQTDDISSQASKSYNVDGTTAPFQRIILPPAGSLSVSARELAQLVRFFLGRGTVDGQTILSPDSVARIERAETLLSSALGFAPHGYGLGVVEFPDTGITFRGHNGGIDAFTSVYGYSTRLNAGYVIMANGGFGVDIGRRAAHQIQAYLSRGQAMRPAPAVQLSEESLHRYAGYYRTVTSSNRLTQPYQEVLSFTRVSVKDGKLVVGGKEYVAVSPTLFRRLDMEAPSLSFAEKDGKLYRITSFGTSVREPAWMAYPSIAVMATIGIGGVVSLVMTPVWLVSAARGRLAGRGGAMVRFLPLLALVALLLTFGLPLVYLTSGSIPSSLLLAVPGPFSYTIMGASIAFPVLALLGLLRAWTASDAGWFARGLAFATSLAVLLFSVYAASIGWVGAQTWTM